jgi:hypothetical protein
MKRATLVAFLLMFVGSVAAQDVGTITIFRLSDHKRGWKPIAFCDGQRIAAVQGGKYVKMNVSAGKHTFTSNNSKEGFDLDVKPGGDYYLRLTGTSLSENGKFELADATTTRTELIRMEPLKITEINAGVCRNQPSGQ